MSEATTKTVTQTRHYDSMWKAEMDADQFKTMPGVFTARVPAGREWGLDIVVKEATIAKGNPPMKKHEMELTLEITGAEDRIDGWCKEADKLHSFHTDKKQKLEIQPKIQPKADPDAS